MEPFTIQALAARIVAQFADDDETETLYVVRLVPEGVETADGRIMLDDSLEFRSDRMPMMGLDRTDEQHKGAVFVGNLINPRMEQIDGHRWAVADLEWDVDDDASEFQRMVDEDRLRTVSVDGIDYDVDVVVTERDEEGFPIAARYEFSRFVIGGATIVPFQAMDGSEVERVASGTTIDLAHPPAAWFEPPTDGPHRLRVTDEGRVYGYVGTWDSCHIGGPANVCLTPPRSLTDYAYFLTGTLQTAEGDEIPVGQLTMDADHASLRISAASATAHYSNTAMAAADVTIGENEHGIWVAGALRPGLSDAQIRAFRASTPSGDWRKLRGNLEMVACLMVNTPGHAPPTEARVADGEMLALVASAVMVEDDVPELPQLADLFAEIRELVAELRMPRLQEKADTLADVE